MNKETIIEELKKRVYIKMNHIEDKDFVLSITTRYNCISLNQLHEKFRSDKDVVYSLINNYPDEIKYVDKSLLNDEDIFLKTLDKTYTTLKFLGNELKNNKEFIKKVVEKYECGFSYMSDKIKNDKEFIIELFKINPNIITYCGDKILNDYDVVSLVPINDSSKIYFLENIGNSIASNKEYMMKWIKLNGACLQYCSNELQDDENVVLEAIKTNPYSLYYANNRLKNDKQFIMKAVTICGLCLSCLNKNMCSDEEIVMKAVEKDTVNFDDGVFDDIPDNLHTYDENAPLAYVDYTLIKNVDIILKAVETNKDNLLFTNCDSFKLNDFGIEKLNNLYQLTLTLNNKKIIVGKSQTEDEYELYEFVIDLFVHTDDYNENDYQEWFNTTLNYIL